MRLPSTTITDVEWYSRMRCPSGSGSITRNGGAGETDGLAHSGETVGTAEREASSSGAPSEQAPMRRSANHSSANRKAQPLVQPCVWLTHYWDAQIRGRSMLSLPAARLPL